MYRSTVTCGVCDWMIVLSVCLSFLSNRGKKTVICCRPMQREESWTASLIPGDLRAMDQ